MTLENYQQVSTIDGRYDAALDVDTYYLPRGNFFSPAVCAVLSHRLVDAEVRLNQEDCLNDRHYARLCTRCGHIHHQHVFSEENTQRYRVAIDKYQPQYYTTKRCSICYVRFKVFQWSAIEPSAAAQNLLSKLGGLAYDSRGHYGSGFYVELPLAVSHMIDRIGEAQTEAWLRNNVFRADGVRSLPGSVMCVR